VTGATSAAAEIVDPAGAYSGAGASAPTTDPAGTYSSGGASAPTPADPGTYIPVTGATSAAAEIVSPPGTYCPAGASAPIADPGGTYSAAGTSAPTTDPAGTYGSPYALDRLFLMADNLEEPTDAVLSFHSLTAVENYFGVTSSEASLATQFFAGYNGTPATMLFSRYSLGGQRPHLFGGDVSNLTLNQLQSISGSLSITFQGWTYSASINLSGVASFSDAASAIQSALNANLPVAAVTSKSSITPVSVSFTGSLNGYLLQVTSVSSGSIELGALISGPGIAAGAEIVVQNTGTPGGPGLYTLYVPGGTTPSETMTETYGVLTVGSVTSGTVAVGEKVTGAGVAPMTAIEDNLSGTGAGSTWVVNNAQTVAAEKMTMTAPPLVVAYNSIVGATANRGYFEVSPNGQFGFDNNPSSLSYMSGTAAAALGLTQASGALNTAGGEPTSAAAFMNNLVQTENSQFGSFQALWPQLAQEDPAYLGDLAAWAQSTYGLYTFNQSTTATPPAGSSLPATDPAGTYSGPGASAPTLAQPGYYVPTAGASSETPDDPGYYTPYAGATAEILALPPVISNTVSGQSTPPGRPDTPFASVTISDPNIATTDSLSIQVTGAGGTLADGAGFNGLTASAPGVYLLSGTAAAITSELDALVFTPSAGSGTTNFTLTDTTSVGTRASVANTTVTVDPNGPVAVSVATFLGNQSTLDQTAGGFSIFDTAANITANLDQLNDPNINAITISDNGQVGPSVQQLTSDATAIGKLQNLNSSPVLPAINDTAADVQAGLSTLVADATEIASITASNGPVAVSTATFLADQSTLDKIVGGFAISDTAANVAQNLDALNADTNVSSIALTDGGAPILTLSIAEALNDTRALSEIASPHRTSLADTAADIELITSTQASTLQADGYTSVASTSGPVAMTIGEATYLSGDGIAVTGAPVVVSGTVAAMAALPTTEATTLVGQGYTLAVLDTAADTRAMSVTQINALAARDVTQINASDAAVLLRVAQISGLEAGGIIVSAPAGDSVVISDTAANLGALTASQISGLPAIGATGLVSTNANVSYTSDQTAAIIQSGLSVSAAGSFTVTENFANGNYSVYQNSQLIQQKSVNPDGSYDIAYFNVTGQPYSSYENIYNTAAARVATAQDNIDGSGNLILYANGFTITSASGSKSVTIGSDTFAATPHSVETTTVMNSKSNETFVYGAGFGQDAITGFLAPTTSSHDFLQFNKSMFGFSSTATQTADAKALLSNFATGTTNTTITDLQGDTLTLNGVTIATLQANLADFKFT
jgi:hypothetical protein